MKHGIFITGTDTGVGKTWVATGLLRSLAGAGIAAVGMKPVAAGIEPGEVVADDVRRLLAAGSLPATAAEICPYMLPLAVAPHVAAAAAGVRIALEPITSAYAALASRAAVIVVEGAGGALVPLDDRHDMLDIPARLGLPVLVVVGLRLGCINHGLLTALAVRARGLEFAGWVANQADASMIEPAASIAAIATALGVPPVGDFRWGEEPRFDAAAFARMGLRVRQSAVGCDRTAWRLRDSC